MREGYLFVHQRQRRHNTHTSTNTNTGNSAHTGTSIDASRARWRLPGDGTGGRASALQRRDGHRSRGGLFYGGAVARRSA